MLIPDDPDERQTYALRIVAQRCLYGVDKNPLAVEMAKLSLWLLTLAKDKPFEFLDHNIRCGDSLVGIHNLEQLRKFNLDGKGEDNSLFLQFLDPKIKEAIALRRQITDMQANTVEDVEAQDRLLREANEKIDRLKCAADFLIAAEFTPGSAADKRAARDDAAITVAVHFNDSDLPTFRREAQKALAGQVTFHWPLEFPEVMVERGGFDAFVGNPPFLGGKRISTEHGDRYAESLKTLFSNSKGAADYCSYFFRNAFRLLRSNKGCFGLLATNTISQGDTRTVGLAPILEMGGIIYCATKEFRWPGSANVFAAQVHIIRTDSPICCKLNDCVVAGIDSFLEPATFGTPHRLARSDIRYAQGMTLNGEGFVIDRSLREQLIEVDARNGEVLFPYLNAQIFNSPPSEQADRWAINFGVLNLEQAQSYPAPFSIVKAEVKPHRDTLTRQVHESRYWLYWDKREAFFSSVSSRKRLLVCPIVTKHLSFEFYSPHWVFTHRLKVFDISTFDLYSVLQSVFHGTWARQYSSTLKQDLNYSTSDAFDTFPFPLSVSTLETIGAKYHGCRTQVMKDRNEGLTKTYNRFHDPDETSADIQKLRQLHVEMDNAVAAAYGWTDLDLGHGFHETKQGVRYTISEPTRREVLARLLKLNHERYAEEVKQGLHEKKKPKATKGKKEAKANTQAGPSLFHQEEDA